MARRINKIVAKAEENSKDYCFNKISYNIRKLKAIFFMTDDAILDFVKNEIEVAKDTIFEEQKKSDIKSGKMFGVFKSALKYAFISYKDNILHFGVSWNNYRKEQGYIDYLERGFFDYFSDNLDISVELDYTEQQLLAVKENLNAENEENDKLAERLAKNVFEEFLSKFELKEELKNDTIDKKE